MGAPVHILLVDDNPADVDLMLEAFELSGVVASVHVAIDGAEALHFLRGEGAHARAPRPNLVLLDLNLPGKDGRAVLGEVKRDVALRSIPVVVMTSSGAPRDVVESYALEANCYIQKPISFSQYISIVKALDGFWLRAATFPPAAQPAR